MTTKVLLIGGALAAVGSVIVYGLYTGSKEPNTIAVARSKGYTEGKGNTNSYGDENTIGEKFKDFLMSYNVPSDWWWSTKEHKFFGEIMADGSGALAKEESKLGFKDFYAMKHEPQWKETQHLKYVCKLAYEKELDKNEAIAKLQLEELSRYCTYNKTLSLEKEEDKKD